MVDLKIGQAVCIFSTLDVSCPPCFSCQILPSLLLHLAYRSVLPAPELFDVQGKPLHIEKIMYSNFAFNFIFSLLELHLQKS